MFRRLSILIATVLFLFFMPAIQAAAAVGPTVLLTSSYNNNAIYGFDSAGNLSNFATGLAGPGALTRDALGNVYTANYDNGTITKITPAGAKSTYATVGGSPFGVIFDSAGNLFVSIANGGTIIKKITPGLVITTYATGLSQPDQLAIDAAGNLYAANQTGNTISKITPNGATGIVTPYATLVNTIGIAFDSQGFLYASVNPHNGNGSIVKIAPGGGVPTFFAAVGDPYGIHFDAQDNLYVSNATNPALPFATQSNILKITPGGSISVVAQNFLGGVDVLPVPEPTSIVLLASGAILMIRTRRNTRTPQ